MAADLLPSPESLGRAADAFIPKEHAGFIKLELQYPRRSTTIASVDPEPYWTLDDLCSEINSLELQLGAPSAPLYLKQIKSLEFSRGKELSSTTNKPFVMCISDDIDMEGDEEISYCQSLMTGTRFSCTDLELSDSEGSEDEFHPNKSQSHLTVKKSPEEGFLFEYELEHQLKVKEEVRNKLSALELDQRNESARSASVLVQLEKYIESRREIDRRLDKQYQRKTAEALDKHLSAIQRDHEQRSQIEERRIRDDAALEEARKKEKALHEEKLRQEKAKEEAEARLKAAKIAEERQRAALEAAKKASEDAAEKEAARIKETAAAIIAQKKAEKQETVARTETEKEVGEGKLASKELTGIRTVAADSALKAEANRLQIHKEVTRALSLSLNQDFGKYERQIFKHLKQITGTLQIVRTKARDLVNILKDPVWPPSISILKFGEKVVAVCENQSGDSSILACAHVILLVTSQVPAAMDLVLAELHKACMYTVPKHLQPPKTMSKTKDYLKMIGYREENGEVESSDCYLGRLEGYMKLYAALVQTEVQGITNPHGLKEGWTWLARFLNNIPATRSSAFALEAFLKMAGFALWKKYRFQFEKILAFISNNFLPALREQQNEEVGNIIKKLERYLEDKVYLHEPEGWHLQNRLMSSEFM